MRTFFPPALISLGLSAALLGGAAWANTPNVPNTPNMPNMPNAAAAQISASSTEATATLAAPDAAQATALDASANPAALTASETTTSIENPYGLGRVWAQSDGVAKITLLILVLMSVGSWYVIFIKLLEQSRMRQHGRVAQASFWASPSLRQAADGLEAASPYRFIAEKGLESATRHEGLLGAVDFNTWVTMSLQRALGTVQSRLQDSLAVLATVGSTAPFVGLFGTVWGIYHALVKIGMSGQASIDKVAGPVGEALIMTAIGLAVAVPAVLGYNWLVRRNKALMEEVNAFGADLHAVLLSSGKP